MVKRHLSSGFVARGEQPARDALSPLAKIIDQGIPCSLRKSNSGSRVEARFLQAPGAARNEE
ncbi:hypothetical protein D9599_20545 [Roseomonas sp. KE2513]|nr:hypothetical protein [Roseomonas sp. KE2513]